MCHVFASHQNEFEFRVSLESLRNAFRPSLKIKKDNKGKGPIGCIFASRESRMI